MVSLAKTLFSSLRYRDDLACPAKRPANSRLDLTRLWQGIGATIPSWNCALTAELDLLAGELNQ
jgi:dTDP-4-dehydrorhamnose reductase